MFKILGTNYCRRAGGGGGTVSALRMRWHGPLSAVRCWILLAAAGACRSFCQNYLFVFQSACRVCSPPHNAIMLRPEFCFWRYRPFQKQIHYPFHFVALYICNLTTTETNSHSRFVSQTAPVKFTHRQHKTALQSSVHVKHYCLYVSISSWRCMGERRYSSTRSSGKQPPVWIR
jgi:hypothetical protein